MTRRPAEFNDFPDTLKERAPWGASRAVVKHWVDGDTVDVFVQGAFQCYPYVTLRLADIDAPEINRQATRDAGLVAKAFAEWLAPPGTPVVIYTSPDPVTFGRYVAEVMLADGREIGAELVNAGHAVPRIAH